MKRIIPDAKDMKKRAKKSVVPAFICIVLLLAFIVSFLAADALNWFRASITSEIHYSLYVITDECMNTYYQDQITPDGLVFSLDGMPIPEDCRAEFLGDGVIEINPYQTKAETQQQGKDAFLRMKDLGANFMHIDNIIRSIPETNSLPEYQYEDENEEQLKV